MLSHVERVALIEAPHLKLERLRCDLIDIDGSVIDEFGDQVSSLSINYERTGRVNRMVSMTTTRELHWGRHRVAPYITISSSSGLMDEDVPLGVFATTRAPRNREADPREFQVTGYDLLYLVDWPLIEPFTARAGTTTVLEYVAQLISSRGVNAVGLDPSRADLLGETRTWAFTEQHTTLDVINDLLGNVGYDTLAMSTTGVAVAGPILHCGQRPSLWTYDADSDTSSVVVGAGDYDDDCTSTPNHWTFYIDSVDRATPISEGDGIYVVQNDSDGPCSIVERGGVFPAEPVRVEALTQADLVAQGDKIVAEEMHAQQRLTLETDLNPYHDHRDVVHVVDSRLGIDGRFLVDEWSMDVFDMSMRMTLAMTIHHTGHLAEPGEGQAAPSVFGPRVTPGVVGATANPDTTGYTVVRKAAGTYNAQTVAAGTMVLPAVGAEGQVTFTGQTSFAANSKLYGVTLSNTGTQWTARVQATNVTVEQCDFVGNPTVEHIRWEQSGMALRACKFAGNPTNHTIKVDGRTTLTGGGVIADCEFGGSPVEDAIQPEGQTATTIEYCSFVGTPGENYVDVKDGDHVIVRGLALTSTVSRDAVLIQSTGGASISGCRIGNNCFVSFGANLVSVANSAISGTVFEAGSTLRLRKSFDVEVTGVAMSFATFILGTSTADDWPRLANIHHNTFTNLTISIGNASSTTITNNNTYAGTTSGSFPSGNN